MGLNIEISLERDIREMDEFFDDLKFKVITAAARQGINKTVDSLGAFSTKEVLKLRKTRKVGDIRKRIFRRKAKGSDIAKLEGRLVFTNIPLPLILFIEGTARPKVFRGKGKGNTNRAKRSFSIKKGQSKEKKGVFVQKAKRGKMQFQVFRRSDPSDKSKGFKKQSIPSLAQVLRRKSNLLRKIESRAIDVLQKEFDQALKNLKRIHNM